MPIMDRLQEGDCYSQPFPVMVDSGIGDDALLTVQSGARLGYIFMVLTGKDDKNVPPRSPAAAAFRVSRGAAAPHPGNAAPH